MLTRLFESGNTQRQVEYHMLQPCAYCGAPIYWLEHRITGRIAAIDLGFTHEGNVLINLTTHTYEVLDATDRAIYHGWLHALHSNICPQVDKWRGR